MRIGVPKEIEEGEKRAALTPDVATQLQELGFTVAIESKAGEAANFSDELYGQVGVEVIEDPRELWTSSDIILKVQPPRQRPELGFYDIEWLGKGQTLISFFYPAQNQEMLKALSDRGVTALAMDCIPRISRAQKMDALSSMSNIAGYRAVVEAAQHFGRFFTGQITAAGKSPRQRCWLLVPE